MLDGIPSDCLEFFIETKCFEFANAPLKLRIHLRGRGGNEIDATKDHAAKAAVPDRQRFQPSFRELSRTLINLLESIYWLPPRDSNPDMLLQRQLSYH
jgi:hypothetical protein